MVGSDRGRGTARCFLLIVQTSVAAPKHNVPRIVTLIAALVDAGVFSAILDAGRSIPRGVGIGEDEIASYDGHFCPRTNHGVHVCAKVIIRHNFFQVMSERERRTDDWETQE